MKITGKFDIDIKPQEISSQGEDGIHLGRMSFDKTFYGALEASSKGEMLTAMTAVKGSAGYVAIEQVIGCLSGKQGSFVLQHFGTMDSGNNQLTLEVIPNSGTGELTGLQGKMNISIDDGQHHYEFEYGLA
ncbi:MAG: DUF3224 domain-containing protein [Xanthomonadales bacterium]|nr:DUF3224 domain-containing protein [Xanthomonadales bacterium]